MYFISQINSREILTRETDASLREHQLPLLNTAIDKVVAKSKSRSIRYTISTEVITFIVNIKVGIYTLHLARRNLVRETVSRTRISYEAPPRSKKCFFFRVVKYKIMIPNRYFGTPYLPLRRLIS